MIKSENKLGGKDIYQNFFLLFHWVWILVAASCSWSSGEHV